MQIVAFADANPAPGSAPNYRIINLVPEYLGGYRNPGNALYYDAPHDRIYVTMGPNVIVFDQASVAQGNAIPSRVITPAGAGYDQVVAASMQFDAANDVIWLGTKQNTEAVLLQIANASTAQGTVTPTHTYPLATAEVFRIDPQRGILYTTSSGSSAITKYDMAGLQEASALPAHTPNAAIGGIAISAAPFNSGDGLALDVARDRLYEADRYGRLNVIDAASSATPSISTISLTAWSASYDAGNDRLYVGGANGNGWIFNGASSLNASTVVPAPISFGPPPSPSSNTLIRAFGYS